MSVAQTIGSLGVEATDMIVAGSGLLEALGLRKAHDADIVVKDSVFDELARSGKYQTGKNGDDEYCRDAKVEIWRTWYGETFEELLPNTVSIDGYSYLTIAKTIAWKADLAREKDFADIRLLEGYNERNNA